MSATAPAGPRSAAPADVPVLEVDGLSLSLSGTPATAHLVQDVSFSVGRGECLALIGESGCGKTLTSLAVLGLLPRAIRPVAGEVRLAGTNLLGATDREITAIRGRRIGAIFQDPMSSLDPTMRIGDQIAESRRIHLGENRSDARAHAAQLLDRVGIARAQERLNSFPFELSGGMQQRVMIAAAMACEPDILLADEPTTALDVTVQQGILDLLRSLRAELGLAVLLVTHDLGVVADLADRVAVMYAGQVVERGSAAALLADPLHPYTRALLGSVAQTRPPHTVLPTIPGRVPVAAEMPTGCRFRARCPYALPGDCDEPQVEVLVRNGRPSRCARAHEIDGTRPPA